MPTSWFRSSKPWARRERRCLPAALLAVLAVPSSCMAHTVTVGPLVIVHPIIAAPRPGDSHVCAHVTIRNRGDLPDRLLGMTIDSRAAKVVAQETGTGWGLAVPPRGKLELRQGICLRIPRPDRTLEPDMGMVPGRMEFERTGPVAIDFMIGPPD